jgi:hypothetical protein
MAKVLARNAHIHDRAATFQKNDHVAYKQLHLDFDLSIFGLSLGT